MKKSDKDMNALQRTQMENANCSSNSSSPVTNTEKVSLVEINVMDKRMMISSSNYPL